MIKGSLCFDDVLLVPRYSKINSRKEVDLTTEMSGLKFRLPEISSPMDTVTESEMAKEMLLRGGLGIIHRYNTPEEQSSIALDLRESLEEQSSASVNKIAAAVGAGKDLIPRSELLVNSGVRILCIDVAHGHHALVESAIKTLKDRFANRVTVIAGNVATPEGYSDLSEWGADAVRIGIGGGSICSTRIQTGHGVPTFQSVLDCRDVPGAAIIADGGIKNSGDMVKAIAAGADMVMVGSLLAGTDETPGESFHDSDGNTFKVYRGMASIEAQVAWRGKARSLEGVSTTVPCKGSVRRILLDLEQNIKSGFSYSGARSISEFQSLARFIRQTSSGLGESKTHILFK